MSDQPLSQLLYISAVKYDDSVLYSRHFDLDVTSRSLEREICVTNFHTKQLVNEIYSRLTDTKMSKRFGFSTVEGLKTFIIYLELLN